MRRQSCVAVGSRRGRGIYDIGDVLSVCDIMEAIRILLWFLIGLLFL